MAWTYVPAGWGGESGDRAAYWYNPETGESSQYDPTPSGQYRETGAMEYVDAVTGRVVSSPEEVQQASQYVLKQQDDAFNAVINNPNASSWDKAQAVQTRYGVGALAQLVNQGYFSDVPDIGSYVSAQQARVGDRGFTVGGNPLGIWPVAMGMAAAGAMGGAAGAQGGAGAGAGGGAGAGAGSSAGAGATGFEALGAGAFPGGAGGATAGASTAAASSALPTAVGAGAGATTSMGTGGGGQAPNVSGEAIGGGGAAGGASTSGGFGMESLLSNPQVLGAAGGALLGGLSSSGTQAKTIQTEEGIPDWLMPYVKPTLDKYSTDIANYNVDPYGIMPSAMQQFKDTIGGMYLDPSTNKYLEDYFRLGAERIKGSLSPTFGHMQAFGQHSGYNEALSRGLGDYAVGLYGGAYEKERDRQNQMTAAAPAFLGQSSSASFAPYQQYLSSVGGLGKKKEEPYFQNPWSSVLGGAMFGSQFGNAFK